MKYTIGDKVKLREDLVAGDRYGGLTFLYFMKDELRDKGNVATITNTNVDSKGVIGYDLKGYSYTYSEEMIEGLVEESTDKKESNNMKYKVGDKVKIRRDLIVGKSYTVSDLPCTFVREMKKTSESYDYVTITLCDPRDKDRYKIHEDGGVYWWTDAMFEESDRHKFEECMRKLSRLDSKDDTWKALDRLTYLEADDAEDKEDFEKSLKLVADYLFGAEKKKMTKAEIEAKLGYEIEIVEE